MKYKCLSCKHIIDNPNTCPYCGSDEEDIVPCEENLNEIYRCLVCGHDTTHNDKCPYCGSNRLFKLQSNDKQDEPSVVDYIGDENKELSIKEKYLKAFNKDLPLEGINDISLDIIEMLYRMGVNRGNEISREEILATINELKDDEEENYASENYEINDNNDSKEEFIEDEEERVLDENEVLFELLKSIEILLNSGDTNKISETILLELKGRILDQMGNNRNAESLEDDVLENLEDLIEIESKNNSPTLQSDLKYLKLLETMFDDEE